MSAKDLLKELKDVLEIRSQLDESNLQCSVTSEHPEAAEATIAIPIDGGFKLYKIKAVEIGMYRGIESN